MKYNNGRNFILRKNKMTTEKITGLALLRVPFPENQISKLPKPTISNDEWKKLPKAKCPECGGYHPISKTIHLSYVGHAALTDRLLDCDPNWSWEPLALGADGLPVIDRDGGMWIKLTVCGITRLGYGDAQGKTGGNATKERIGDALRNAAMRFGAALELWHKGELHIENDDTSESEKPNVRPLAGVLDNLANEEVQFLRDQAIEFIAFVEDEDFKAANDIWGKLDNEEKTGLWSMLDSKTRSAFKKYQDSLKAIS